MTQSSVWNCLLYIAHLQMCTGLMSCGMSNMFNVIYSVGETHIVGHSLNIKSLLHLPSFQTGQHHVDELSLVFVSGLGQELVAVILSPTVDLYAFNANHSLYHSVLHPLSLNTYRYPPPRCCSSHRTHRFNSPCPPDRPVPLSNESHGATT